MGGAIDGGLKLATILMGHREPLAGVGLILNFFYNTAP